MKYILNSSANLMYHQESPLNKKSKLKRLKLVGKSMKKVSAALVEVLKQADAWELLFMRELPRIRRNLS